MPTVPALNNAKQLKVSRSGDEIHLVAEFRNGSSKSATVTAEQLRQFGSGPVRTPAVTMRQQRYKLPHKWRAINCAFLYFAGGGSDLIIVSFAALRRAARVR